jgi:hypothetical protein
MSDFEQLWFELDPHEHEVRLTKKWAEIFYRGGEEALQAKLDEQAEELAALRGFAQDIYNDYYPIDGETQEIGYYLSHHELIDEYRQATTLLTGVKE